MLPSRVAPSSGVEEAAVALPLLWLRRRTKAARPLAAADEPAAWLAPRWLRPPLLAAVAVAGVYWIVERAGA